MEEKNEMERGDELMLPGFRFHPTDEELVGFYLKRKVQQKPLSIELIKQLDIYKYDPWDLPKLATTGEKEWYFYCPRDRKYRNSARPNRVTGAGFWKATGTDRPIYSSEGSKCIGLKKSLVFYTGRAAKGIKTDWMMHEFRLPSLSDSAHAKRPLDKNIPPNDSWAICRIFKKTSSMAQRALSHSWVSPNLHETTTSGIYSHVTQCTQFNSECISGTTEDGPGTGTQFSYNGLHQSYINSFPTSDVSFYKPTNPTISKPPMYPIFNTEAPSVYMFSSPLDMPIPPSKCSEDIASIVLNLPSSMLGDDDDKSPPSVDFGSYQLINNYMGGLVSSEGMNMNVHSQDQETSLAQSSEISDVRSQWGAMKTISFPFSLGSSPTNAWKPSMPWDSPSCPSELSTTLPTNKCYT